MRTDHEARIFARPDPPTIRFLSESLLERTLTAASDPLPKRRERYGYFNFYLTRTCTDTPNRS
jgi:hypothetical protein